MISTVTTVGGGGGGATREMVTESLEETVPSVQFKVRVVGVDKVGYQGWLGAIGPSEPEIVIPVAPEGEVSWQTVASVEDQA